VNVKDKGFDPAVALKYLWNHPDLSRTTQEKIAYHSGKEYYDSIAQAHAYRPESELR
jgi:hypothetical protein